MKTFKTTLIMAAIASSLFFQSCESDPALDSINGAEVAQNAFDKTAPCDNTTNPTCAFVEDMDYITAAPIIAERALRLCPEGFNCIMAPTPNSGMNVRYCSTSDNVPGGNCDERIFFFASDNPIIPASDLNGFVCSLNREIRKKLSLDLMPVGITITHHQDIGSNGEFFFYYVANVDYDLINKDANGPCF